MSSDSFLLSEQIADAHFIYKPVARLCRSEPDPEIDHDVLAEFQIASWKDLMDLLVGRQQIAQRPGRAIILKTQIQPPIQFITKPHARLEVPSFTLARPAQRARENRVDVYLKASEFLLDDRTKLKRHGILFVLLARKAELDADAHINRQLPRFRQSPSWANAPAGVFVTAAGAMREHQVPGHFKMIGDSARQFVSQMELIVCRSDSAFESLRSFADVIDVRFEIPHAFGHGFIFVNLNFKRVLRANGNGEDR